MIGVLWCIKCLDYFNLCCFGIIQVFGGVIFNNYGTYTISRLCGTIFLRRRGHTYFIYYIIKGNCLCFETF